MFPLHQKYYLLENFKDFTVKQITQKRISQPLPVGALPSLQTTSETDTPHTTMVYFKAVFI
jgi:hypothetical protein